MIELLVEVLAEIDGRQVKFGYEDSKHNLYTLHEIKKSLREQEYCRKIESSKVLYHIEDGKLKESMPLSLKELVQFELIGVDSSKLENKYLGNLTITGRCRPDDIGLQSTIQVQGHRFLVTNIRIDCEPVSIDTSWNLLRSTFGEYTVTVEGSSI